MQGYRNAFPNSNLARWVRVVGLLRTRAVRLLTFLLTQSLLTLEITGDHSYPSPGLFHS